MRYSINSAELGYNKALDLVAKLKEKHIKAYTTSGGIEIHTENKNEKKSMFDICDTFNVKPQQGVTLNEENLTIFKKIL